MDYVRWGRGELDKGEGFMDGQLLSQGTEGHCAFQ